MTRYWRAKTLFPTRSCFILIIGKAQGEVNQSGVFRIRAGRGKSNASGEVSNATQNKAKII